MPTITLNIPDAAFEVGGKHENEDKLHVKRIYDIDTGHSKPWLEVTNFPVSFEDYELHFKSSTGYSHLINDVKNGDIEAKVDGLVVSATDLIDVFKTYYQEL